MSNDPANFSRPLVARCGVYYLSVGLCVPCLSPRFRFLSILEYLSRVLDLLHGQRFLTVPSVFSIRGRSSPPGVNLGALALPWSKGFRTLGTRGGDMIPLEHGAASTDMQLCCGSCEMGYLYHFAAIFLAVLCGSATLSRRLSQIVLSELWDNFHMLMNPVCWV